MNQNDSAISLSQVKKDYGAFSALKGIDLEINRGELFGFLGPNGAGKTTLIRIMVGIIKPSSGTVKIRGNDILTESQKAKSCTGYIPDRPYLYEKLTPLEYFDFVSGLYSVPPDKCKKNGEEMLKMFSLWDWRNELIESFSHGMKQKVAMTASLMHDPDVIIVDEPMVGLDPKSVRIVKDFFKDLVKRGKTIFLTTHTLSVAEDLCDRIGIINRGQVAIMGTLDYLKDTLKSGDPTLENLFLKITEEEEEIQTAPMIPDNHPKDTGEFG
ncbi:MAG: ABC transporter ATP-binding protein [Candidatus Riflebacteria bacterium]|nr:ABC transporter ATP-binding protein [Candidatus Riflebacteria bacterium]